MSKKSDLVAALIKEVKLRHPMPSGPTEGLNLLEQGAVIVLLRHMTQKQAEQSVKALKGAYEDWNEVRVCQAQEISEFLRHGGRKKGVALLHDRREAAMALKEYLQDVFQETDALDLEELPPEELGGVEGPCVFLLATHGEGDPTDNTVAFHRWASDASREPGCLAALQYAAFGLGDQWREE